MIQGSSLLASSKLQFPLCHAFVSKITRARRMNELFITERAFPFFFPFSSRFTAREIFAIKGDGWKQGISSLKWSTFRSGNCLSRISGWQEIESVLCTCPHVVQPCLKTVSKDRPAFVEIDI